ncbi:MAG: NUDIX hydrolase [Nitrospirota bacterium]
MGVLDKRVVWEGSFLRASILTYRDHAGRLRTWEAAERVNCRGIAVIVPLTAEGEFLLTRQFRPVVNNFVVEFPAGLHDREESLVEAAGRELIEETKHTARELVFLARGPLSSGMSTEILSAFLAKDAVPAPPELLRRFPPDESEQIEVHRVRMDDMYRFLASCEEQGDYIDVKVYGLVELAKRKAAGG